MHRMKIKDFDDAKPIITQEDLENIFTVHLDKRDNYVYNLNRSLYFNVSDSVLQRYEIKHDMHWTLLSYKLYNTTHFAWLLMKINDVSTKDVFKKLRTGDIVKYLPADQLGAIKTILNDN